MYCPQCGKENKNEASFCAFCGAQISLDPATDKVKEPAQDISENGNSVPTREITKKKKTWIAIGITALVVVIFLGFFLHRKEEDSGKVTMEESVDSEESKDIEEENAEEEQGVFSDDDLRSMARDFYLRDGIESGIRSRVVGEADDGYVEIELYISLINEEKVECTYQINRHTGQGHLKGNDTEVDFFPYYREDANPELIVFSNPEFQKFLGVMYQKDEDEITTDDIDALAYFAYYGGSGDKLGLKEKGTDLGTYENRVVYSTSFDLPENIEANDIFWFNRNDIEDVDLEVNQYSKEANCLSVNEADWMLRNVLPYLPYFSNLKALYLSNCKAYSYFGGWMDYYDVIHFDDSAEPVDENIIDPGIISVSFSSFGGMNEDGEDSVFAKIYGFLPCGPAAWIYLSDYYTPDKENAIQDIGRDGNIYYFYEDGEMRGIDISTGEVVIGDTTKEETGMEDGLEGNIEDFGINEQGYSEHELLNIALNHYFRHHDIGEEYQNDYDAMLDGNLEDETVSIQIFVDGGDSTFTYERYYVNPKTLQGTNFMEEPVNLLE